jgi:hypothetical protein
MTLRLTYKELAERTGRTPEGARMLARNHHWRIERGNDGKARVAVDEAELEGGCFTTWSTAWSTTR